MTLPMSYANWRELFDEDDNKYLYNAETGETAWPSQLVELPEGWSTEVDDENKLYFYQHENPTLSQWFLPLEPCFPTSLNGSVLETATGGSVTQVSLTEPEVEDPALRQQLLLQQLEQQQDQNQQQQEREQQDQNQQQLQQQQREQLWQQQQQQLQQQQQQLQQE